MARHDFIHLPDESAYTLGNARVPACCIEQHKIAANATDSSSGGSKAWQACVDGLVAVDLSVDGDRIAAIRPAGAARAGSDAYLDVRESIVMPAFVDLHTHIGAVFEMRHSRQQCGRYACCGAIPMQPGYPTGTQHLMQKCRLPEYEPATNSWAQTRGTRASGRATRTGACQARTAAPLQTPSCGTRTTCSGTVAVFAGRISYF